MRLPHLLSVSIGTHVVQCEPLSIGLSILFCGLHTGAAVTGLVHGQPICNQTDEHGHSAAGNKNGLLLPNTATDQGKLMSQSMHHAVFAHDCSTCCSERCTS